MANKRQFGGSSASSGKGSGGMRQFGDQSPVDQPGSSEHCVQCDAMLTNAIDGTLTAEQQASFDLHAAHCAPCGELVADARRGVAWLEMLRSPAPEPPADLLDRILAQTSLALPVPMVIEQAGMQAETALAPGYAAGYAAEYGKLIPFPRRAVAAVRRTSIGNLVLQPRLAMTAAMAFFSVALTMNLTGFHPGSLRASDLAPGNLRKQFYHANASVVRYYEGLRVVYELESRVHELQTAQDVDAPAGSAVTPANSARPSDQPPANQADPADQKAPVGNKPADGQGDPDQQSNPDKPADSNKPAANPETKPDGNRGTSRREEMHQTRRLVVVERLTPISPGNRMRARMERKLV